MTAPPSPPAPTVLRISGQIREDQTRDLQGHTVRVTAIAGGRSKNGYVYGEAVLKEISELLEGAHAYADHSHQEADVQTRSVRDIVGFYHDARYIAADAMSPQGRVDATLHILEAADWLWSLVHEACELGRPDLVGLSIDVLGHWQLNEETRARDVTRIVALNSCDVVTRPSAGGTFRRILHDETNPLLPPIPVQGETSLMEHTSANSQPEKTAQASQDTPAISQELIHEQQQQMAEMVQELQRERAQIMLERRLLESVLPEPVKENVRARFQGRLFEEHELLGELKNQQEMLASLAASGLIRGNSYEKASVGSIISETEKVQAAFDGMFHLEIETVKLGNIRPFSSIREAYARVTGDAGVSSLRENARPGRISEADTTTASFSYLLGSSMNKRLLKDYQAWPAEWMRFVSIVPVRDFKQQNRVRLGAFGSLPIVAENNPYSSMMLSDAAAVYIPQKHGNLVVISRETILNDDLQAIQQIPQKLAVAAAYTLAEFVYGILAGGGNIYDGSALFTTGSPHNNTAAGALSSATLQSGVTAIRKQANDSGKRLGLRPRYLVVPPELEWTAMVVTQSANVPGSANNDINPMQGYVTPIVSAQLTNATQWFLAADPREIDTIEIGFVGGQVNPALFVQSQPEVGLNFTQDALTYKIRHEYGGAVVDYRGLYRGN
jgi:hypothetical protein